MKSIAIGIFNYDMVKALWFKWVNKESKRNSLTRYSSTGKKWLFADISINPRKLKTAH